MRSSSMGQKLSLIRLSSHSLDTGSMSSLTRVSTRFPRGVTIFLEELFGTQQSSHIFILRPFPTLQMLPFLKVCVPAQILCHTKEEPFFKLQLSNSPLG